MEKWEYFSVTMERALNGRELKQIGDGGWKLSGFVWSFHSLVQSTGSGNLQAEGDKFRYIFIRPKEEG